MGWWREAKTGSLDGSFLIPVAAAVTSGALVWTWCRWEQRRASSSLREQTTSGYEALIGGTPMVKLAHLSQIL
eukprot:CAMPEP_0172449378 /NCGR_PEP_ID=MMETSP1065-20121228/8109_1 /TAXON_ID=265537 /ORGANISM="Amphiprora paludosa, Strain CCMP125" /LENGTH=72 /DNA_ID=CAMNT_0013201045 /DNA_START=27 /DNA_END=242 /DNA_ORIENTATION=-